jgi:hypothetical protein
VADNNATVISLVLPLCQDESYVAADTGPAGPLVSITFDETSWHPPPLCAALRYVVEGRAELRRQEEERGFNERPEVAEKFFREGRAGKWPRALTKQQKS